MSSSFVSLVMVQGTKDLLQKGRTVARESSIGGLYVCAGGLDI